jgi:hypothetical protein
MVFVPARQATEAGGIVSLEPIPGLLEILKILSPGFKPLYNLAIHLTNNKYIH